MPKRNLKNEPSKVDQLLAKADLVAAEAGIEIEAEDYSLEWYRADWPARKKTFIEREIRIQNAFENNSEVPLILNDAQLELHQGSLAASVSIIQTQLQKNPRLFLTRVANPK